MRVHEIESWALNVIDQVITGQPNEDSRVELKATWIEPHKAARQIAAHANTARGAPVLWLIGVDEKSGVTGASLIELANWYSQIESKFDGLAPSVTPVNVPVGKETIVALLFDTERAPFVVKVEGTDRLEVPWRASNSTRSARRDELLRLLAPLQKTPSFDVLSGSLSVHYNMDKNQLDWQLTLMVYVVPGDNARLVLPYHSCRCVLYFPVHNMSFELDNVWVQVFGSTSATLFVTGAELIVEGPGMFLYHSISSVPSLGVIPGTDAHVRLDLHFVGADRASVVEATIPTLVQKRNSWAFGQLKKDLLGSIDEYGNTSEE